MKQKLINLRGKILQKLNIRIIKLRPRSTVLFAKEHFKDKKITAIEIGICQGTHSKQILNNLNIEHLYLIDPFEQYEGYTDYDNLNNDFKICENKLKKYKNKSFIFKYSDDALNDVPIVDYIYIDGNHTYPFVKKDIENYYEKVKEGGILCGHDYHENFKGLIKAVHEHFGNDFEVHKGSIWAKRL